MPAEKAVLRSGGELPFWSCDLLHLPCTGCGTSVGCGDGLRPIGIGELYSTCYSTSMVWIYQLMTEGSHRTRFLALLAFFWEMVFFGDTTFFLAPLTFFREAASFFLFFQRCFALSLIFIRASSERMKGFEALALRSIFFCCWALLLHSLEQYLSLLC